MKTESPRRTQRFRFSASAGIGLSPELSLNVQKGACCPGSKNYRKKYFIKTPNYTAISFEAERTSMEIPGPIVEESVTLLM